MNQMIKIEEKLIFIVESHKLQELKLSKKDAMKWSRLT